MSNLIELAQAANHGAKDHGEDNYMQVMAADANLQLEQTEMGGHRQLSPPTGAVGLLLLLVHF